MADGLIPDFSPEAYTSGQGTGYAQVFNLQGPNPFETTQNTYDKLLAIQKDSLKKSYENEEKRQEKLDDFLSSIHDYDNAWEMGKVQLGKEIDTYGNLISGMRAQGKAIDVNTLNKNKKKIADLAKVNEDNQKNYAKIAAIMSDPVVYTDEERQAFQDEVKAEAQKDIFNVQEYLGKWSASLATPNIAADYIKLKPEAKSDKSGYIKATRPEEAKTVVVDNVWASYPDIQKKKSLSDMIQLGLVKQETVEAAKMDGEIDFENQALKDEIGNALFTKIEPYLELDITPKPVYSSSNSRNVVEKEFNINAQERPGGNPNAMQTIAISKSKGGSVPPSYFVDEYGQYNMTPSRIVYIDEKNTGYVYDTDENGKVKKDKNGKPLKKKAPAAWYIVGTIQKEAGSKAIEPGENEQAAISSYVAQKGGSPEDYTATKVGNEWQFYKLQTKQVPYERNKALMKNYGIESLEQVAADNGYREIAGMGGGWNPNGN
jgi:hypothetical protein